MLPCCHRTVLKGLCCDCGAHVDSAPEISRVAMIHACPEILVSTDHALDLGGQSVSRLLAERRAILVVDLDHTLVHAAVTAEESPDVQSFRLGNLDYKLALRPGVTEFLHRMSVHFELHVFTLGTREYARRVVEALDPEHNLIHDRVRSRCDSQSTISKLQEIAAVFPGGEHLVLVLDDRRDVWGDRENVIPALPFLYFAEAEPTLHFSRNFTYDTLRRIETFCGQKLYFDFLADILLRLHNLFFEALDDGDYAREEFLDDENRPNMRNIAAYERAQILAPCTLVFTDIFPAEGDISDNPEYLVANFLGAQVKDALSSDVTHLITSGKLTPKTRRALSRPAIHVVTVDWLYSCYYLGLRVPESEFTPKFDPVEIAEPDSSEPTKRQNDEADDVPPKRTCPLMFEDYLDDESLKQTLEEIERDGSEISSTNSDDGSKDAKNSQHSSSSTHGEYEDIDEEELRKYASQLDSAFS